MAQCYISSTQKMMALKARYFWLVQHIPKNLDQLGCVSCRCMTRGTAAQRDPAGTQPASLWDGW
jgi:hypothetical protein